MGKHIHLIQGGDELSQIGYTTEQGVKRPTTPADVLKSVDIRTVDAASLVDIRDVVIKHDLPREERLIDFVKQIKNPYCYKYKKAIIKVEYEDAEVTPEEGLKSYFMSL
jgi:hypothetical protein